MNDRRKVVVAMSGGVDSSVAAALLVEAGYAVTGMMLRLWSEPDLEAYNRCCTPDSMAEARRVANRLGIPFYVIDVRKAFREIVVEDFLQGYSRGITPNPCLICNRQIRWGLLLENTLNMGADYLATGHYARLRKTAEGVFELLRGLDPNKDQSYVLSVLDQSQLGRTMLPVGEYTKPEVRGLAHRFGLAVAERSDSQDLCFLSGQDYRAFLARHAPQAVRPGKIIDRRGNILGDHSGLAFYTIGQRKGLGIASTAPLYVLETRVDENLLIVGEADELGQRRLRAGQVHWISGHAPGGPITAGVKVRYRSAAFDARVIPLESDLAEVEFTRPVRDITPGQRAVFYEGDRVLGGGWIISGYD
jgi:tRNA-specific 2-thiouridylase